MPQASPEDMILMDALWNGSVPHPSSAELVSVAALVEEDVPSL
jgi:hypothetical protein